MSDTQLTATTVRTRLNEIVRRETPIQEKVSDVLDLGVAYLGADFGYLAVTDEHTDRWDPVVTTELPEGVPEHTPRDLSATYCRRTVEGETQVALHDIPAQGETDDPGYQSFGCHCYLGTPVVVDDAQYGTVCFVAEEPRTEPFDDAELLFGDLLARVLGHELECDRKEQQLRNQSNLTTVLNRVLRHNLRNSMTIIRGHAQLAADQLDDDSHCDRVLKEMDELIELGETARDLESVLDQTAPREPTDIGSLATCVASTVEEATPAVSVTVDAEDEVTTAVRPSFEQALSELIENAAKHAGTRPIVAVSVDRTPTDVVVQVTDDGPGLPKQEREVLEHGAETPLVHGSGLGLWLVHWIATTHGGSVESTVCEDGTTMTLSVPHITGSSAESTPADSQLPELTRARDQYHAAFEESNEAMVITDGDARILDTNETASTLYDLPKTELRGRSLSDIVPDSIDFEARWETLTTEGTVRDTVTVLDAAGRERIIEYAATANIVPDQHLIIAHDITDRVRRTAELRRKTRAIDNAPIGITISDPHQDDNPLIYVNETICEQTGYAESTILGQNCRFMQGPGTDRDTVDRIRTAIQDEEPITEIIRNYRRDGTPFWNRLTIAPITDEAGRLTNYVGFQEDVTGYVERDQTETSRQKKLDVRKPVR
ncbi:PAS domain S-box protein [Halohasta salina]|uniref:PAS domain S-box protein n=1 Tax=Halohasta salina TaxID=2961621 RepID=UPI0020A5FC28|nr:PAS domain S-box protein [Halohasta salina]